MSRDLSNSESYEIEQRENVICASEVAASQLELLAIAGRVIAEADNPELLAKISDYTGGKVTYKDVLEACTTAAQKAAHERGVANGARDSIESIRENGLPT